MLKKELEEKIVELSNLLTLQQQNQFNTGIHLTKDPFIPEYIGFTETEHRDNDGVLMARIYTRDGWNIAKHINTDIKEWAILGPDQPSRNLIIESMYDAIVVLRACGMDISLGDYFEQSLEEGKVLEEMGTELKEQLASLPMIEENSEEN